MESPTSTTTRRRTCFIEEDDGLVSLADEKTQPAFSHLNHNNQYPLISRPLYYTNNRRINSFLNLSSFSSSSSSSSSSISSPRSVITAAGKYHVEEPQQHFLDFCFLCKKRIPHNSDIFMYRGDTPFCSEECRQKQIDMDESKENKRNISSINKAMRNKDQRQQSTSPNKTKENYPFRPGTVAAA